MVFQLLGSSDGNGFKELRSHDRTHSASAAVRLLPGLNICKPNPPFPGLADAGHFKVIALGGMNGILGFIGIFTPKTSSIFEHCFVVINNEIDGFLHPACHDDGIVPCRLDLDAEARRSSRTGIHVYRGSNSSRCPLVRSALFNPIERASTESQAIGWIKR